MNDWVISLIYAWRHGDRFAASIITTNCFFTLTLFIDLVVSIGTGHWQNAIKDVIPLVLCCLAMLPLLQVLRDDLVQSRS